MAPARPRPPPRMPTWPVYLLGLVPAVYYFWQGIYGDLGADPLKVLEHALGEWALRFLIAGLAVTPLRRELGINLLKYRRALGLLAFLYVLLHLGVYAVLDQGLDWRSVGADILRRPYITVGMAGFLLLLPLAATSFNAAIRWLGGRNWSRLHKLVYPAALAGALHYVMLVKSWPLEPLVYAAIVLALLGWRLWRGRSHRAP
ncbi:protein-methionine-sulfoxide reductase heme-binding subunit MsrQ [Niveispirillum fermenti]|uniref:protein-methionine-sulfoxide reductase heme-binding subunit MsrQ n=1 Tax=Niveispirillum fermenti TaxID=1233113 RepID=UPI003A840AB8